MPAAYLTAPPIIPAHDRGCTGKMAFDSRADARRWTERHGSKMKHYLCLRCGCWHNTNYLERRKK